MRYCLLALLFFFPALCWSAGNFPLSVVITGLSPEEKKIVLSNLSIQSRDEKIPLTQEQALNLYRLGPEEISTTLEALGYYHPKIQSEFYTTPKGYRAEYTIELGPPILIKSIFLKLSGAGQFQPELLALLQNPLLKTGAALKHSAYETFKRNLLGKALELGYLDAVFTINTIHLDTTQNRADIHLELNTGMRYVFGEVNFESPPYPSNYLKRYVPFSQGTPYTTEKLLLLQKNLIDTDLFSKVRIDPDLNDAKRFAVPLKVRLVPRPHNKYTASLGFNTDLGPRGGAGWERKLTTFPGHRIHINGRAYKRLQRATAQYTIPGKNPATDRFSFGTQIIKETPSDHKYSLSSESGVTYIQKRGYFEQIFGVHYLSEVFRTLPTDPKQQSHFVLPSVGCTWSNIKEKALLEHGLRVTLSARGTVSALLSTNNLIQGEARVKWIAPINELTRLILRSDVGATAASHNQDIPLSLRFFTGGDHTVRGFGYQSLGPRKTDKLGNEIVVGGRFLFVGSAELERKIYKNIGVATFVDTGNAMNRWGARLATGAGLGLRYETPLGPLRLDVARPLMRGKHRPRIHLTFGMDL